MEYNIWTLAERFGWTLDYIEGLPMARLRELLQIDDGRSKSQNSLLRNK